MLAPDVVYSSSGVGAHSGIEAVMTMMSGFFRRFPDVNWTCSAFAAHERDGAEFHYVLRATESATGQVLQRAGIQRVWIDPQGDLRRIEVRDGSGTNGATCG